MFDASASGFCCVPEYQNLRAAFAAHGGRSLSDFARAAVLSSADLAPAAEDALDQRLGNLEEKLSALDGSLQAVLARLGRGAPNN